MVIGIPNGLRCGVVLAAAQAGKHIVIKKALCLNMAEADEMIDAARPPLVTGEDVRVVLEVVFAAYESARTGCKVQLPFRSGAKKPIDLWRPKEEVKHL